MTLALLPPRQEGVDVDAAHAFLEQFHAETNPPYPLRRRLRRVRAEIERTGTYVHTEAEVEFGAKVAWRNAARCIGRLYWHGLHVRDRRAVHTPSAVADAEPLLSGGEVPRPSWRPVTKFEARALSEGRDVHDFVYSRPPCGHEG